jgi:hypothetical protein
MAFGTFRSKQLTLADYESPNRPTEGSIRSRSKMRFAVCLCFGGAILCARGNLMVKSMSER